MSIVSEIERIKTNIANAYTTCEEKGATMPSVLNSANLVDCIGSITGGNADFDSGYVTDGLLLHLSGLRKKIDDMWIDDNREIVSTLYDSPTYDADNKCYKFDGSTGNSARCTVANISGGNFTLEVYYKQDNKTVFDVMVGTKKGEAKGYGITNGNEQNYCWIYNTSVITLPSSDRPEQIAGRKTYSSLSRDNTTMFFELKDIERDISKTYTGVANNLGANQVLICASGSTGTTSYSNAQVYAVRIYNRKLTDEEIQQNYEQDVRNFGA